MRLRPSLILIAAVLAGCAGMGQQAETGFLYKNLPVATGSAEAGAGHTVTLKGAPLALSGAGIAVGNKLRRASLTDTDLQPVSITKTDGVVRIISVVPSLETPVCEQQTHYLSERNQGLDKDVEFITISMDTPVVQSRFAGEAGIRNMQFLSDLNGEFGAAHGLLIKDRQMLARAVMVVDSNNVIRYLQITPELAQMPNMPELFRAAFARARGEELKDALENPDSMFAVPTYRRARP
jgi:thiol peroxidase